jgi:hypothetical protein
MHLSADTLSRCSSPAWRARSDPRIGGVMVRERTLATEKYSEASELRVVEIRVSRHGVGELLARVEHVTCDRVAFAPKS